MIPWLLCLLCTPLAASSLIQSPGGTTGQVYCPNTGVNTVGAKLTPTVTAACKNGFVKYKGFGLDLSWEDPVCPTLVIYEPAHSVTVPKPGMRFKFVDCSKALALEFECDEDTENCNFIGSHELPGAYPFYVELPCES